MQDLELKRKRIETGVKVGATLLVGFLVAPFVFIAIKGLIGLIIAAGVAAVAINFAPWAAAKLANWRIKALKHEASQNPVETLQNEYMRRVEALKEFGNKISSFSTEVKTFATKLVSFKKQWPEEADKFDNQLLKMQQVLELRTQKYREAKKATDEFELNVKKAGAIWDMGQAAAALNKSAGMNMDDFYAKLQTETALDSIQKTMDSAFTDLEMSLLDEDKPTKSLVNEELKSIDSPLKRDTIKVNA